jgi:hypothetical protein
MLALRLSSHAAGGQAPEDEYDFHDKPCALLAMSPIASLAAVAPAANEMDEDGPIKGDMVSAAFAKLERKQWLLATCARHYQQPADHFASPVRGLIARSDALRTSTKAACNQRGFETPHRR